MAITFEEYLSERFVNVLNSDDKEKYKDEVFSLLHKSYVSVGGLKGNGFRSPDDMVNNIPMWKLVRKSGAIVAVSMYKDKGGRKRVAVGSDGSSEGKTGVAAIFKEDFARAYFEISEKSLAFHVKILGYDFLKQYAVPVSNVNAITGDSIQSIEINDKEAAHHPQLKSFFYRREIAGHLHTKILFGTHGKKIVITD